MKNTTLIAPLAASAVAAVANAAFVVTQDAGVWATQMATIATYTDPGRISNLTGSGLSWTGGDGWESYALTGGPAGSIQPVGTSPNVTAINFTASTTAPYTFFEFDFVGSEAHWGPSGTNGLYGVLFNITFTPAPNLSGVTVVVNGTQNLVVNGASTGTVGIYQDTAGAGRIDKIQFTLSSGQSAEITGFSVAVIPAPGAMALLGVAGLVGSRRRR